MPTALYNMFLWAAIKHNVSISLLMGICFIESGLDVRAINIRDGKGGRNSYGICQIQYRTARQMGMARDRHCEIGASNECGLVKYPALNVEYAAIYLSYQFNRYKNRRDRAVSAYNAGSFSPKNWRYVRKVETAAKGYLSLIRSQGEVK